MGGRGGGGGGWRAAPRCPPARCSSSVSRRAPPLPGPGPGHRLPGAAPPFPWGRGVGGGGVGGFLRFWADRSAAAAAVTTADFMNKYELAETIAVGGETALGALPTLVGPV